MQVLSTIWEGYLLSTAIEQFKIKIELQISELRIFDNTLLDQGSPQVIDSDIYKRPKRDLWLNFIALILQAKHRSLVLIKSLKDVNNTKNAKIRLPNLLLFDNLNRSILFSSYHFRY